MNKSGPILIIEDDPDDQMLCTTAFKELNYPNEVLFFREGDALLEYLAQVDIHPFLIISDINLPKYDGIELKSKVLSIKALNEKHIPYLFFSTSTNQKIINNVYGVLANGYFIKPTTYAGLLNTLRAIIDYWKVCYMPDNFYNESNLDTLV